MIEIVAEKKIVLEEKETYIALAKELVEKSQQEAACIKYDMYEDINDPSVLTMIEIWENMKGVESHNNSEHVKRIVPLLNEFTLSKSVRLYKKI